MKQTRRFHTQIPPQVLDLHDANSPEGRSSHQSCSSAGFVGSSLACESSGTSVSLVTLSSITPSALTASCSLFLRSSRRKAGREICRSSKSSSCRKYYLLRVTTTWQQHCTSQSRQPASSKPTFSVPGTDEAHDASHCGVSVLEAARASICLHGGPPVHAQPRRNPHKRN